MTESLPPTSQLTGNQSTLLQLEYLFFDPGLRTGTAGWKDPKSIPLLLKTLSGSEERDSLLSSLDPSTLKVVGLEDYRVRNEKFNHQGSRVPAAKVIGDIEGFCRRNEIQVVLIPPNVKKTAAKWAGIKIPRGHMPDKMAAYLIGIWYLRTHNLMLPRVLQERGTI